MERNGERGGRRKGAWVLASEGVRPDPQGAVSVPRASNRTKLARRHSVPAPCTRKRRTGVQRCPHLMRRRGPAKHSAGPRRQGAAARRGRAVGRHSTGLCELRDGKPGGAGRRGHGAAGHLRPASHTPMLPTGPAAPPRPLLPQWCGSGPTIMLGLPGGQYHDLGVHPSERDPVIHTLTHTWPGRAMSCSDRYGHSHPMASSSCCNQRFRSFASRSRMTGVHSGSSAGAARISIAVSRRR
jgi:hypothetical protein